MVCKVEIRLPTNRAMVTDPNSAPQIAFYGVPLGLWLTLMATVLVAALSAVTAIVVVWRSNANSRKNLREQLKRGRINLLSNLYMVLSRSNGSWRMRRNSGIGSARCRCVERYIWKWPRHSLTQTH